MSWVDKDSILEYRDCCNSTTTENHRDDCPLVQKVAASLKKDSERWLDSYVNHNSESVRRRVVAWMALNNGNE